MSDAIYGSDEFNDMVDTWDAAMGDNFSTPGSLSSSMYSTYQSYISLGNTLGQSLPSDGFDQNEDDFMSPHSQLDSAEEATHTVFGLGAGLAGQMAMHLSAADAANPEGLITTILTNRGLDSALRFR